MQELLDIFLGRIIREDGHLGIFFGEDFMETESSRSICSFGHDIEASWLIWEAAEILGDASVLAKARPLMIKMADAVLREGVDKDGGLFLESMRFGSHVRTNKHWWLQAENLVGFMNAYQLTGDARYWETVKLSHSDATPGLSDEDYDALFAYLAESFNDTKPEPQLPPALIQAGCVTF